MTATEPRPDEQASAPTGARMRLVVELEPGGDPIRGSVEADRRVRPFVGWIELTAALEEARAAGAAAPRPTDPVTKRSSE